MLSHPAPGFAPGGQRKWEERQRLEDRHSSRNSEKIQKSLPAGVCLPQYLVGWAAVERELTSALFSRVGHIYEWPFFHLLLPVFGTGRAFSPQEMKRYIVEIYKGKRTGWAGSPSVLVLENVHTCFCTVVLVANEANVFYGSKLCTYEWVFEVERTGVIGLGKTTARKFATKVQYASFYL